jgi:Fur family ferric uptake transcriptional regulator
MNPRMERRTRQRDAIRALFTHDSHPLSPKEILDRATADVPTLSLATVYRTIASLVDEGVLKAVSLPGQPPVYELAGKEHHHHFHCRRCGRTFELDGCLGNVNRLAPKGFHVDDHELTLFGTCPECAA